MEFIRPFVSIIIPAKNEDRFIERCLDSVCDQTYPADKFEIIVIDNNSHDQTATLAKRFDVNIYHCDFKRIGAVRNFGVSKSKGVFLAFVDADCVVRREWIEDSVRALQEHPNVGAIGGDALARENGGCLEKHWFFVAQHENEHRTSLNGASMFFSRKTFTSAGLFKEDINAGEDTHLAEQIRSLGLRLVWIPTADVIHYGYPRTTKEFFKRQFWISSSYLSSNLGFSDRMFLFTVLGLISIVAFILSLIFGANNLALFSAIIFFSGPLLFSIKKIKGGRVPIVSFRSAVVSFYSCVYFVARILGLAYSVTGRNLERKNKKNNSTYI